MCFAINLYNTLCIHTLVVHGPDKYNSSVGRVEFFRKVRAAVCVVGCAVKVRVQPRTPGAVT